MSSPTMLPPAPLESPSIVPPLVEFDPDTPAWRSICQTAVETFRPGFYSSAPPEAE